MTLRPCLPILTLLYLITSSVPATAGGGLCAGYSYSTTFTMSRSTDLLNVMGKSTIGGTNPCSFYTENTVHSPNGRTASAQSAHDGYGRPSYNAGWAEATSVITIAPDDGVYSGTATFSTEDDTVVPWAYTTLSPINQQLNVNGFVQRTSTSWTPSSITKTGSSTFVVNLLASNHCGGAVVLLDALTGIPPGLSFQWAGASSSSATVYTSTVAGQLTNSTVQLNLLGGGTGTVQATATLQQLPPGCDPRDPPTGSTRWANLTVTN